MSSEAHLEISKHPRWSFLREQFTAEAVNWCHKILFIINFYAGNNIFKHIKKTHGHHLIKVAWDFKQKKAKFEESVREIAFIKLCKKEQLIPAFAKVSLALLNGTYKMKRKKSACLVMETELQNKHWEKLKLRKDIWSINVLLSTFLSVMVYNAF